MRYIFASIYLTIASFYYNDAPSPIFHRVRKGSKKINLLKIPNAVACAVIDPPAGGEKRTNSKCCNFSLQLLQTLL
jgi:hypothetical protein